MAKAQAKIKTKSAGAKKSSAGRKKVKKSVSVGKAIINATFNNTLVYLTDVNGNVLAWNTAGGQGFKGSRKSTPYAAQKAAEAACIAAKEAYGLRKVDIYINGPGAGGEAAARAVGVCFKGSVGFVKNITGIPFNGCRAEKERRV